MDNESNPIQWFRQASPYINEHRSKVFVVMLCGDAVKHSNITHVIQDIALLSSLGTRIVIVHGIRPQLSDKLSANGQTSQFVRHLRVTDKEILDAAIESCSLVRAQLERELSMGVPNSPMHGTRVRVTSCNAITARPAGIIDGVDLQHTGVVRKVDAEAIQTLVELGNVVLLSPIGYSPTGEAFNLEAEQLAAEIALSIQADKLIAFSGAAGLVDSNGSLIRELSPDKAEQLVLNSDPQHAVNNTRQVKAAMHAVRSGVSRAHIMSYSENGALLQELFTLNGAGTLITEETFEATRRANSGDVPAIYEMLEPLVNSGVLVKREPQQLADTIAEFTVTERDGMIIGVAALHPYPEQQMGEIACIVTHPDYRDKARGSKLLATLEKQALDQKLKQVFVLTTQTSHWFLEQQFVECSQDQLPPDKRANYSQARNSKVLIKSLA